MKNAEKTSNHADATMVTVGVLAIVIAATLAFSLWLTVGCGATRPGALLESPAVECGEAVLLCYEVGDGQPVSLKLAHCLHSVAMPRCQETLDVLAELAAGADGAPTQLMEHAGVCVEVFKQCANAAESLAKTNSADADPTLCVGHWLELGCPALWLAATGAE